MLNCGELYIKVIRKSDLERQILSRCVSRVLLNRLQFKLITNYNFN